MSVALLAGSSGCHRKPTGLTPIPYGERPPGGVGENQNVPSATPMPSENPVVSTSGPGGIPVDYTNGKWAQVLANGTPDRNKFSADTVYFDFDKATVKSSEESKLQDVAAYFKGNATDALIIEGNCDERGTEKYNLSLGERRALAIREYLANLGVDPQRIKTVTYGASKPVDPGHNEAAWSKNRRGDLVLMTPPK